MPYVSKTTKNNRRGKSRKQAVLPKWNEAKRSEAQAMLLG